MRKLPIAIIAAVLAASCTGHKVEGVVVDKELYATKEHHFYVLAVGMGDDTIRCNVSRAVYLRYDVGDSVKEKYRYLAKTSE